MKTLYLHFFAFVFILTTGCKSVEKLVDQGQYDDAIVLATKKLAGKKNKKTKHVMALEEAFYKVNQLDVARIAQLSRSTDGRKWENIYHYAVKIQDRQNHIYGFLPLVSKNGYRADFKFEEIVPVIDEAAENAAAYLYSEANVLLEEAAITNNKQAAQRANGLLNRIDKYRYPYKDTRNLIRKSYDLGTYHILVRSEDAAYPIELLYGKLDNDVWVKYHMDYVDNIAFDAVSNVSIHAIELTPGLENVNRLQETSTLENWVDVVDRDGNLVYDSLGNKVQYLDTETINAYITEVVRSKDAFIAVQVATTDFNSGTLVASDIFDHRINFTSDACTFVGDERALSTNVRKRVRQVLLPFPTDNEMMYEAFGKVSRSITRHIRNIDLYQLNERSLAKNNYE